MRGLPGPSRKIRAKVWLVVPPSVERPAGDRFVARAVSGQVAFVQDEVRQRERRGGQPGVRRHPACDRGGIGGVAELSCLVRVDGSLTGCSVTSETPGNQGFGRAAVSLSRYFRLSPRTVDGQAVDGARVTMAIRFDLPKD
ncbi:hypothetical protein LTR94_030143 [Friedmanniomyces endolithicus]|nr:hypothetical protein LTR94_030143 [Friedmanniomyces endolithicus]